MTPLCELSRAHECDKGGEHFLAGNVCHNYTPAYYYLFQYRRDGVRAVLEVGVNKGSSLRMWAEFFPAAVVIGLDIDPRCLFKAERIWCFEADQSNRASLVHALAQAGPHLYDLIVDDGSHQTDHQITTMHALLPYLAPLGTYVIEDMTADGLDRLLAEVPSRYSAAVVACEGGLGPNPYLAKLLVIQAP